MSTNLPGNVIISPEKKFSCVFITCLNDRLLEGEINMLDMLVLKSVFKTAAPTESVTVPA